MFKNLCLLSYYKHKQILLRKSSRSKPVVGKWTFKVNDLVYVKIPTFGSSVNFIFVSFQLLRHRGVKDGYHSLSWGESQAKVFHALTIVISYQLRSTVLWCPTLELLSQTRFLLLLFGSYGYNRNCWFHTKTIINIRNKLPSSCLGFLHQKQNWKNNSRRRI